MFTLTRNPSQRISAEELLEDLHTNDMKNSEESQSLNLSLHPVENLKMVNNISVTSTDVGGIQERIIRERERCALTSISRSQAYQLEKQGLYPKRIKLGNRSVGWLYSETMAWINQRHQNRCVSNSVSVSK